MKKSEQILAILCALLFGIVFGFLISPIKKGMEFGNNAGNTTNYYGYKKEEQNQE